MSEFWSVATAAGGGVEGARGASSLINSSAAFTPSLSLVSCKVCTYNTKKVFGTFCAVYYYDCGSGYDYRGSLVIRVALTVLRDLLARS